VCRWFAGTFVQIPNSIVLDTNVPHGALRVFLLLVKHADPSGSCWPSVRSLARLGGMSHRTVQTHLATLEDLGYIERKPRYRPDGSRTSTSYQLLGGPSLTGAPTGQGEQRGGGGMSPAAELNQTQGNHIHRTTPLPEGTSLREAGRPSASQAPADGHLGQFGSTPV
jgi:GntR family transcriptional regulator